MKINRLTEIIILLNKNIVTAKELEDKFEVSTRTIYRDVEELSLSGIPVYMSKGQTWYLYGFCKLKKDARTFRITRIKDLIIKKENFIRKNIKDMDTTSSK